MILDKEMLVYRGKSWSETIHGIISEELEKAGFVFVKKGDAIYYKLDINEGCYNQVKNYLDLILSVNPDDQDLAYYLFEHLQNYATRNSP